MKGTKKTTAETPAKEVEAASEQTTEQVEAANVADELPYETTLTELEIREAALDKREAELDDREAILDQVGLDLDKREVDLNEIEEILSMEKPVDMTRAQAKARKELKAMDNDRKKRAEKKDVVTPTPVYRLNEEK